MNLQPDGASAVHSVLDLSRRLKFERPKFEKSVAGRVVGTVANLPI
jgi:hypothetical protein